MTGKVGGKLMIAGNPSHELPHLFLLDSSHRNAREGEHGKECNSARTLYDRLKVED